MSFLSNAHTHTPYCDGLSPIADMVAEAKRLGFVSLGFSGHASQGFDPPYCMSEDGQRRYFAEVRALGAREGSPRLWAGLEMDAKAHAALKRAGYAEADYVIGSAHYLDTDYRGQCVGVDGDPRLLRAYVDDVYRGDGLAMARAYFDLHARAILADKPDVIGHFDLVRKYARRLSLFNENGAAYRRLALDALERAAPSRAVLELNMGGIARGYLNEPYPTRELLGAWRELGGAVTITSDCHDRAYLNFGFDAAEALARGAGYRSVKRLGTGDALWEDAAI